MKPPKTLTIDFIWPKYIKPMKSRNERKFDFPEFIAWFAFCILMLCCFIVLWL